MSRHKKRRSSFYALRRNPDKSLRELERAAATGVGRARYYQALIRAGRPIPRVNKAYKALIKAINNFPMARSHQVDNQYGFERPGRTKITKKPFLRRPQQAIDYIIGDASEALEGTLYGYTSINDLTDALDLLIRRTHNLVDPGRPAGGREVEGFALQSVHFGNYDLVAETARKLAKASAEIRYIFHEDEISTPWILATALIHDVFEIVRDNPPDYYPASALKSLEGRIVEFRERKISKSRISHILGEISGLASSVRSPNQFADPSTAIYDLSRRFKYFIAPLLPLSKNIVRRRNPDDLERLEKIAKARELYREHKNLDIVAELMDFSASTISKWVKDLIPEERRTHVVEAGGYQKLYDQGLSDKEIAEHFGVTTGAVQYWRRMQKLAAHRKINIPAIQQYQELYDQGFTDKQIMEATSRSAGAVSSWRKRQGLAPNSPPEDMRQNLYDQGATDQEIAETVGKSLGTIRKWRRKAGLKSHRPKKPPTAAIENSKYWPYYQQGLSDSEIATALGIPKDYVYHWRWRWKLGQHQPSIKCTELSAYQELYDEGLSDRIIAERLKIHVRNVQQWRRRRGLSANKGPRKKTVRRHYTAQQKHKAIQLCRDPDLSYAEIAREADADYGAVRHWCKHAEVRRNPDDLERLEKIEEARRLYREGGSKRQIIKWLRVDSQTLNKWLVGITHTDPRIEQAVKLHKQGVSRKQIKKRLRVSPPLLNKWLVDLLPDMDPRIERAKELYMQGVSKDQLRELLHVSPPLLAKWLADTTYVDPRIEEARELYQQGVSKRRIRKQLHTSDSLLDKWLADLLPKKRRLRRRNPDDLERLEKIAEARKLYKKTGSLRRTAKLLGSDRRTIKPLIADLIPEPILDPRIEQARELFAEIGNYAEVGRRLGISRTTARKWTIGVEFIDPRIQLARSFYSETGSLTKTRKLLDAHIIGSHCGVGGVAGEETIKKWVEDLRPKALTVDPRITQARQIYRETGRMMEAARKVGVRNRMVREWVADLIPPEKIHEVELYVFGSGIEHFTVNELSETFPNFKKNTLRDYIKKWLKNRDIEISGRRGRTIIYSPVNMIK